MDAAIARTHNNPPEPISDDPLLIECSERIDAANRLLTEVGEITDMETADKVNFFAGQIQATWKALDDQRLQEGRDFTATQTKKYRTPLELLVAAKAKVVAIRVAFLQKEEDRLAEQKRKAEDEAKRIADEAAAAAKRAEEQVTKKGGDPLRAEQEARRLAQEAEEARQAAAAAPTKAQITGAYSPRATGLRDVWSGEVTDVSAAFKYYNAKTNPYRTTLARAVLEALQDIANRDAKLIKDEAKAPPGIRFIKERK